MVREFYSIPEAAALLGISRIAVFKRVKSGRMAALRFGRNWAVPAAELERLGQGATALVPPPAPAPRSAAGLEVMKDSGSDEEMNSMGWD